MHEMQSPHPVDINLILTGSMGPAQLQVARRIAELLRLRFVDFEARFEAVAGMPAEEMRTLYGETRLKSTEGELLAEMTLYRGTVLLIGAGTLLRGDTLPALRQTGPVIALVATIDAVLQRLHLAMGARFHAPRERELALGRLRRDWAIRGHDGVIEFDTSYLSDAETVAGVAERWRELTAFIDWRG
jgi:shikimate kinase